MSQLKKYLLFCFTFVVLSLVNNVTEGSTLNVMSCVEVVADNTKTYGKIEEAGDVDCFRITLSEERVAGALIVRVSEVFFFETSPVVTVYKSDGSTVVAKWSVEEGVPAGEDIMLRVSTMYVDSFGHIVSVREGSESGSGGIYALSVSVEERVSGRSLDLRAQSTFNQIHAEAVRAVAVSPNGRFLASVGVNYNTLGFEVSTEIRIWNVATGKLVDMISQTGGSLVTSVSFSKDSNRLAGGYVNGSTGGIYVWSVDRRGELSLFRILKAAGPVYSVSFSPTFNNRLASGGGFRVHIWDSISLGQQSRRTLGGVQHIYDVNSVSFSRDGTLLASGSDDYDTQVWSVSTGRVLQILRGRDDVVNSVAFSPTNNILAAGYDDGTIYIWDVTGIVNRVNPTRREFRIPDDNDTLWSMSFSPDGSRLAIGGEFSEGNILILDANVGNIVDNPIALNCGLLYDSIVYSVVFFPSRNELASGGTCFTSFEDEGRVNIWTDLRRPTVGEVVEVLIGGMGVWSLVLLGLIFLVRRIIPYTRLKTKNF